MKILLDTSFLLLCMEKGRDYLRILEEKIGEVLEPVILENVVVELKKIASQHGKKAKYAKAVIEQLSRMEKVRFQNIGAVDEALQRYALEHKIPIVTADAKLVKKLSKLGIPYMTVGKAGKPLVRVLWTSSKGF